MRSLAHRVGIEFVPNWTTYIDDIRKRSDAPSIHKFQLDPFKNDVLSDLASLKTAWRNPTLHFTRNYSEEEAEDIFRSAKRLMSHLAEWLREIA
jgi:hypothetical protein